MCVIIHKPQTETLAEDILWQCFNKNKDGAGLVVNGQHSEKGFFKFESLWKQVRKYQNEDLVIHCRIATSGTISKEFCHPFKVQNSFLFHNGVIPKLGTKKQSDTVRLALILNQKESQAHEILEHLANKTKSRFCLVSKDSMQKYGQWFDIKGLSFSNLRWKPHICPNCYEDVLSWKYFCSNCGSLLKGIKNV